MPAEEIAHLLEPAADLATGETGKQGHTRGAAWFLSHQGVTTLDVDGAAGRGFAVGQHPFVLPLLGGLALPSEFYILGLAKHNVTLFRCASGECVAVPLPESVPVNLETMLAFDEPDHDRDNRAAAGGTGGQMRMVRFGTGSEADDADRYLHQFFKLLDHKLQAVIQNKTAAIVLAGVRYEVAEFQRLTHGLNVVREGFVEGAWKDMTPAHLLAEASEVLRRRYAAEVQELTSRLRESESKVEGSVEALKATLEGRVWRLFVSEEKPAGWLQNWREALELNRVAVEAIRRGADVFLAPPGEMPNGARVAALPRY